MLRLAANRNLLEILRLQVEAHPELRFSQLLRTFGFVQELRPVAPETGMDWQNDFYMESETLLKRVVARLPVSHGEPVLTPEEKFENLTVILLSHKYRYYELNRPTITDYEYDKLESRWVHMGTDLGVDMDNYEHWVDWDENHPLAAKAKELVNGKS